MLYRFRNVTVTVASISNLTKMPKGGIKIKNLIGDQVCEDAYGYNGHDHVSKS